MIRVFYQSEEYQIINVTNQCEMENDEQYFELQKNNLTVIDVIQTNNPGEEIEFTCYDGYINYGFHPNITRAVLYFLVNGKRYLNDYDEVESYEENEGPFGGAFRSERDYWNWRDPGLVDSWD